MEPLVGARFVPLLETLAGTLVLHVVRTPVTSVDIPLRTKKTVDALLVGVLTEVFIGSDVHELEPLGCSAQHAQFRFGEVADPQEMRVLLYGPGFTREVHVLIDMLDHLGEG